jgi:hypothetical protein
MPPVGVVLVWEMEAKSSTGGLNAQDFQPCGTKKDAQNQGV